MPRMLECNRKVDYDYVQVGRRVDTVTTVSGDDGNITGIAFDSSGQAWYTESSGVGFPPDFGLLDTTNPSHSVTHRKRSGIAAHGIMFDRFSGELILFGDSHISQVDPAG